MILQPEALPQYLENCVNGRVQGDGFLQRLLLGGVGFGIEEFKSHPHRLDYELRAVRAYGRYFHAEVAKAILQCGMDVFIALGS